MHNINVFDDLWPAQGDWLRYIGDDTFAYRISDMKLTHNNEYEVISIRYVPCADAVLIIDDNSNMNWVPLYKFSFLDAKEFYNKGEI